VVSSDPKRQGLHCRRMSWSPASVQAHLLGRLHHDVPSWLSVRRPALSDARHRRIRPKRHPRSAAQLLRCRRIEHRTGRAGLAWGVNASGREHASNSADSFKPDRWPPGTTPIGPTPETEPDDEPVRSLRARRIRPFVQYELDSSARDELTSRTATAGRSSAVSSVPVLGQGSSVSISVHLAVFRWALRHCAAIEVAGQAWRIDAP
jgi:hypothetical protein